MKAIATLLQDDPYMKLTPKQRCDARRERRVKFFAKTIDRVHEVVELPVDKTQRIELPIVPEIPAPPEINPVEVWVDRQKTIHKTPWFSIVDEILPDEPRRPRIEEIQRACARHYGLTRSDIISARRTAQVVRPRQVAYYLSKVLTLKSLPEIGRRFGGRDHTTALSGIRKIERLRPIDDDLNADILAITASLGGSIA